MTPQMRDEDRFLQLDDQKKVVLDWYASNRIPPSEGIYDEPVRYYKANERWAVHIAGIVRQLADVHAWPAAQDSLYNPIQQILIFLEGILLPEIDCGQVEECLETSDIITNIYQSIEISVGGDYNYNSVTKNISNFTTYNTYVTPSQVTPENGCDDHDKNRLWSWIKSLVFKLHKTNLEFLNSLFTRSIDEGSTLDALTDLIPMYQALDPAIMGNIAIVYATIAYAGYIDNINQAFLLDVACDLFCERAGGSCEIGFDEVLEFIRSRLPNPPSNITPQLGDLLALAGSLASGADTFYYLSFLQLSLIFANEKFGNASGAQALGTWSSAQAEQEESGWKTYCEDCAPPIDGWTIVFDFANDYVPVDEEEIVIRNAFDLIHDSLTANRDGIISSQWLEGYKVDGSDSARRRIQFDSAALVNSVQINWRSRNGSKSCDFFSGTGYNFPEFTTSSVVFVWSPVRSLGGINPPYSIGYFEWTLAPRASIRYMRLNGDGAPPLPV